MAAPVAACSRNQAPAAPVIVVVDSARFTLSGAIGEGPRSLELREAANQAHVITLGGYSAVVGAGATKQLAIELSPGVYDLICVTHGTTRSLRVGLDR